MLGGGKKTTNSTLHTLHYIHFLISRFISEKLQKYPPVLSRHPAIFPDIFHQISRTRQLPHRPAMVRGPASRVLPHPSQTRHLSLGFRASSQHYPHPAPRRSRLCSCIAPQVALLANTSVSGRSSSSNAAAACEIGCMRDGCAVICYRVWHCNFSVHEGAMPAVQCAGAMGR